MDPVALVVAVEHRRSNGREAAKKEIIGIQPRQAAALFPSSFL
jgi:hypothetical protein